MGPLLPRPSALLECDLAIRAFRFDRGRLPASLDELEPEYLSTVPLDPFSDGPLRYRSDGAGYLLCSVGPDGKDDGGKRVPRTELRKGRRGNLFVDTEG